MSAELNALFDAYRAENSGNELDERAVEQRIIRTLSQRRNRKRRPVWIIAPGTGLIGSMALAAAMEPALRSWWGNAGSMERAAVAAPVATPPRVATSQLASPPPPDPLRAPADPAALRAGPLQPPAANLERNARRAKALEHGALFEPPTNPVIEAYAAARRLQTGQELLRALSAWDAYLEKFPDSPLLGEAQFNRVRCLLELGSYAEAKRSLEPFVSGSLGRQRQTQAVTLLRAIDERER